MSHKKVVFSPVASELRLSFDKVNTSWQTLGVMGLSLLLLATSGFLISVAGYYWLVLLLNSVALYMLYIVMHDASHNAVFKSVRANELLGHFCILFFNPGFAFKTFRFIHMRHHRYTNEAGKDPDLWADSRFIWLLPFKWLTTDVGYVLFFFRNREEFKTSEQKRQIIHFALLILLICGLTMAGYGMELLFYWVIPFRIALFFLTLFLDYLPHIPYQHVQSEAPFKATNVIEKKGWLDRVLFFLMLGQNYHLVHHLFPQIPFHQSRNVWKRIKYRVKALNR